MHKLIITAFIIGQTGLVLAETKEFSASDIVRVELSSQTGNVKIIGEETDKVKVEIERIKFDHDCVLNMKKNGKVLEIENEAKSFFTNADCEVNFTIRAPKKIDLELKNSRGKIDVAGTSGKLDVKVASGSVLVQSDVKDLTAKAGSGSIEVNGLSGNANVKVGSGDIKLTYAKDPGKGEVDIKSGSGDATLFFPPKMKIHSKVLVGSGEAYNELGDYKDAKFLISFKAGSGTLNIKESPSVVK